MNPDRLQLVMRAGTASIWLATGLSVVSPTYREIGTAWLDRLGLPPALMWATCAFEVLVGAAVLVSRPSALLAWLQIGLVLGFSTILAALEPSLLAHPYGVLTKNLPLVGLVLSLRLVAVEGWSSRATSILRAGVASIWITEGLFPKIFFQQDWEVAIVAGSGLSPIDPARFLALLGAGEFLAGVATLVARGRALVLVLAIEAALLVVLPILVSIQDPTLWVHPFGPLTKNLPILAGTCVLALRTARQACSSGPSGAL